MSDSIISRSKAKAMVDKYQSAPAGSVNPNNPQIPPLTKFVHFSLAQFFELMQLNGIVANSDTVSSILQNKGNFGIKLYFAQHADASDCPDNNASYIGSNTIVIMNTVKKNSVWYDIPDASSTVNEIQEFKTPNSGQALDKGSKCPPECGQYSNTL